MWPGQPGARLQMAHTDWLVPPTSVLLQGAGGGPQTLAGGQSAAGHGLLPVPYLSSLLPAPHGGRCQGQRRPEPPAVRTCPLRGAAAVVGVHAVHTDASVLAAVPRTVVNVLLAVLAGEACSRGQPPGQASPRGQALTVLSRLHWALAPSWLDPGHPALGGELLSTACPVMPTALEPSGSLPHTLPSPLL